MGDGDLEEAAGDVVVWPVGAFLAGTEARLAGVEGLFGGVDGRLEGEELMAACTKNLTACARDLADAGKADDAGGGGGVPLGVVDSEAAEQT